MPLVLGDETRGLWLGWLAGLHSAARQTKVFDLSNLTNALEKAIRISGGGPSRRGEKAPAAVTRS